MGKAALSVLFLKPDVQNSRIQGPKPKCFPPQNRHLFLKEVVGMTWSMNLKGSEVGQERTVPN
jgi:hypothetical protein